MVTNRSSVLGFLLALISFASIWIHLGAISQPIFDEAYYIPSAQKYLNGYYHHFAHPPLSRLLIAAGQAIAYPGEPSDKFAGVMRIEGPWPAGEPIVGYRLFPALFGALVPLLMYAIGLKTLRSDWLAFAFGLTGALDNALVVTARAALPEPILIFFSLAFLLVSIAIWQRSVAAPGDKRLLGLWLAQGGLFSAAVLVKISVLPFGVIFLAQFLRDWRLGGWKRPLQYFSAAAGGFALVFALVWSASALLMPGLHPDFNYALVEARAPDFNFGPSPAHQEVLSGQRAAGAVERIFLHIADASRAMYGWHSTMPGYQSSDPAASPWYQWLVGGKAIYYRWEAAGPDHYRMLAQLGNPVVWLISLLGVLAISAFRRLPALDKPWALGAFLAYLVYMGLMASIDRKMYLYHYLPVLMLGTFLFFLSFREYLLARPAMLALLLIMIAAAFLFYAPFTYYWPLDFTAFSARNLWPAWHLYWP